ncbi:MAG: DNA mismatch repair protein MutS, partial [bacterium]
HKVVVVEQIEDPKTATGIVKRDIVEIITPGTALIDDTDRIGSSPSLAALVPGARHILGLAVLNLATGSFAVDEGPQNAIVERLRVAEVSEVVIPDDSDLAELIHQMPRSVVPAQVSAFGRWNFDGDTAVRELNDHFGTSTLEGFGIRSCRLGLAAAGAILRYLRENHREQLLHIDRLTRFDNELTMVLDYGTVRNLELVRSIQTGTEEHSLFSVINKTQTAAGGRRLRDSLLRPFRIRAPIEKRLAGVAELVRYRDMAGDLTEQLKGLADLERLCGRLGVGKLNPRQAAAIGAVLRTSCRIREIAKAATSPLLAELSQALPDCDDIVQRLEEALVDEPPLSINKGDIIRPGHSGELDGLNGSIRDARAYIASLQQQERQRTGIPSLKVGFNKVFGYYLEVTKTHSEAVPPDYIRKQTLVNAERYITADLKKSEDLILSAEEKIFELEEKLYRELVDFLESRLADLISTAHILAELDLVNGLATLAVVHGYCRPELFEDGRLKLVGGRHPVVESVLPSGSFVANDVDINTADEAMVILTGPNMSGKSTYLRQLGLIVIMAQIGSFIPADSAEIGLVDRVFTRVGALDNLARGQSTFLVEMVEAANILNNGTENSLILLDEIGRGTSTFDGLSIAWAVVEYINERIGARTLFATHYHELTSMAEIYQRIRNYQVAVKRWEDKVVFLHQIIPGGCDDSYGIEVGRLAGLPRTTISRAKQILRLLESGKFNQSELGRGIYQERLQPSFFDPQPSIIEQKLREVDLDNMTPVQALQFLEDLKGKLS